MNVWIIISLIVLVHDSHAHIPIFKSHEVQHGHVKYEKNE
jgi:hypothetical protein